jgi:hypothetical protein
MVPARRGLWCWAGGGRTADFFPLSDFFRFYNSSLLVSEHRDWPHGAHARRRAKDRRAAKQCKLDTQPLPARHITLNGYFPDIGNRGLGDHGDVGRFARSELVWHRAPTADFPLKTMARPVSVRVMAVSLQCRMALEIMFPTMKTCGSERLEEFVWQQIRKHKLQRRGYGPTVTPLTRSGLPSSGLRPDSGLTTPVSDHPVASSGFSPKSRLLHDNETSGGRRETKQALAGSRWGQKSEKKWEKVRERGGKVAISPNLLLTRAGYRFGQVTVTRVSLSEVAIKLLDAGPLFRVRVSFNWLQYLHLSRMKWTGIYCC